MLLEAGLSCPAALTKPLRSQRFAMGELYGSRWRWRAT